MEKSIDKVIKNNKEKSSNVNKLIKLSLEYIDRLNEAEAVRPAKIRYAKAAKYEKAAAERKKELDALGKADKLFKKMKKIRKLIKE